MTAYILKRLLLLLPTLLGALILIYVIMNLLPGDLVQLILGAEEGRGASPELVKAVRQELGLDRPVYMRFFGWFWGILHLDLGNSLYTGRPVLPEIWIRLPISFTLMAMAVMISAILSIPFGIFMALRRDSFWDYALRIFLIGGISIPSFWMAMLVLIVLVVYFQWFPTQEYATIFTNPVVSLKQLFFPALVLGYLPVALQARLLRSQMLEVMGEDYIRTVRSKGMPERTIIWLHVLKNALPPVVTLLGLQAATLIASAILVEYVFGIPGIGSILVTAIERRDIPLMEGIMIVVITFVIVLNLVVDITYSFLDPRIRYGGRS